MKVLIPSKFDFRKLFTSRETFIYLGVVFAALVVVFLQNKVLPELMSNAELADLSALSDTEIKIFGIFNAPPSLMFALYWLPISLLPGFITPAFVTVVFFMVSLSWLILAANAIYRRTWPTAIITLLFAILSGSLTYGYGIRPELLLIGYVNMIIFGLALMHRGRNLGVVLLVIGAAMSPLLDVIGLLLGILSLALLLGMYTVKPLRKIAPRLNSTDWFITFGLVFILSSPFVVMATQGANYTLNTGISLGDIPNNAANFLKLLVLGIEGNPFFWSQNWPVLSIGGLVLLMIGTYALITWRAAMRNRLLLGLLVVGVVLPILLGPSLESMTVFIAVLPFCIVAGLRFFDEKWISVFPHNTAAHKVSIFLLSVLIITISLFHLNRQLIYLPQVDEFNNRYTYEES